MATVRIYDDPAEPTLGAAAEERIDEAQRRPPPRRPSLIGPILLALIAAGIAVAIFMWWQRRAAPPPATAPVPEASAPAAKADILAPGIKYPVDEAAARPEPLPPLAESDKAMLTALSSVAGADALDKIVVRDDLVRRIVATVDNLPRQKVAQQVMPVKPAPGWLSTHASSNSIAVNPDNSLRYAAYMRVVQNTDPQKLAAVYLRTYPLFQQAYRELGYPNGYFNDRLVETIDDLLAAPNAGASVRLTQPKVLYEYADSELEQRSAGQKIMMRIGAENEAIVKAKLREFRREIVGPHAKP
jgi:hypothetical protein